METMSLPSRGAWIEIQASAAARCSGRVAPLAGSVDRNTSSVKLVMVSICRSPRGERG